MHRLRPLAVDDLFYPADCTKLRAQIDAFNRRFDALSIDKRIFAAVPRALIVPHAGYVYSGFTANFAYRFAAKSRAKRIVVIGPSHHVYVDGISGGYYERFPTPCGDMEIDTPYLVALAKRFRIGFVPQAHRKEHSTEVQMPFIRRYRPDAKVVELIYGSVNLKELTNLCIALMQDPANLTVVSSDLSHYYPLKKAKRIDRACLLGVQDLALDRFKRCEACGKAGIVALVAAAKHLRFKSLLLDYRTSYDYSGDADSVVGYMSALFYT